MQGLRRTSILENRFEVQDKLQQFALANGDPADDNVIPRIAELYKRKNAMADDYILLNQMYSASGMYFAAHMRNSLKAEYDAQEKSERKNWRKNGILPVWKRYLSKIGFIGK